MSAEIFGFRGGPTYRGASPVEQFDAAMAAPMSLTSTLFDQAKGGVLESFGLGTTLRSAQLPEAAPTEPGLALTRPDGSVLTLPDTPNMRRRQVVQGVDVPLETPQQFEQRRTDAGALSEDAYKSSPYFRSSIPWDAGMTEDRAAALAMMDDAKKVREYYAAKRPITAFIGNLAGQALDPVNYVPIAGPAVRAASAARFGRIGGAAVASALDAAGNTALAALATQDIRETFGDDVSWQSTVSQIATAALIGGAFGTIGGALGSRADARTRRMAEERLATLKTTQEARIALNEGIDALAKGEDVALTPNAVQPLARVAAEVSGKMDAVTGLPVFDRPDFKAWFGDSKVVSADGQPLTVYHGTKADFSQFDITKFGTSDDGLAGKGFYFTYNPEEASGYALNDMFGKGDAPNVIPAYISLKNPLVISDMKLPDGRKVMDLHEGFINAKGGAAVRKIADEAGNDGVIFTRKDGGIGHVVAFEPTQIKSVFNRGTFSNQDPRLIDTSAPRPEPAPEGRTQAEARVAKPDDYKALAAQYGIDPQTGSFTEEGDIAQLAIEGRLTDDDAVVLTDAQATFEDGAAYGEALKSVAGCLI